MDQVTRGNYLRLLLMWCGTEATHLYNKTPYSVSRLRRTKTLSLEVCVRYMYVSNNFRRAA